MCYFFFLLFSCLSQAFAHRFVSGRCRWILMAARRACTGGGTRLTKSTDAALVLFVVTAVGYKAVITR